MKLNHLLLAASFVAASSVSVFASSAIDRKIEDAAKASYNYRIVLDDHVKVKSNEGVVTLTGTVPEKDLKSLAEDTVSTLPGVLGVDNQITIDPALKGNSDSWMAWKIRYQLLVRANVSNRDTTIDVKDGVVTLTGTAANAAEKDLVGVYAKAMDGVKSVKNEIVVQTSAVDEKTVVESVDDASITAQVKYALSSHKDTSALKTKIVTTDGVVVITGIAASDAEKSLAGKLAEAIRGVKSVDNNMTVKI